MSCNTDPAEIPTTDPQTVAIVRAVPDSLSFFGDLSASALPAKEVAIVNKTTSDVWIKASYIATNPTSVFGRDAAPFFTTTDISNTVLRPGDRVTVWVSFAASAETREALLVVETDHPDYESLVVPLSGKYFTGSTLF